jgi:hypothetical protein
VRIAVRAFLVVLLVTCLIGLFDACFAVAKETTAAKQEKPLKQQKSEKRTAKQPGKQKQPDADKQTDDKQAAANINAKHERAALDFVEQHHKELSGLLGHLKSAEPKKYQQAIAELYRTRERLEGFEKRDPERFELELELWKTKSRIQVLAARMTMSMEPELEADLLKLFKQQSELQIRQLEHEQQAVTNRLAKIESHLSAKKAAIEQEPERRLKQLLQTIRRGEKQAKKEPSKKPVKNESDGKKRSDRQEK